MAEYNYQYYKYQYYKCGPIIQAIILQTMRMMQNIYAQNTLPHCNIAWCNVILNSYARQDCQVITTSNNTNREVPFTRCFKIVTIRLILYSSAKFSRILISFSFSLASVHKKLHLSMNLTEYRYLKKCLLNTVPTVNVPLQLLYFAVFYCNLFRFSVAVTDL